MNAQFFINSILLGAGLAMDAFSVSCANALREPGMKLPRMSFIAGVYAFFQFLMPMCGWLCVHTVEERFIAIQGYIPWIALVLLLWIGGKMLLEGIREQRAVTESAQEKAAENQAPALTGTVLLIQGIATSIDALSVGFTIAEYDLLMAFTACLIIAVVTFAICMGGLEIGKKAGLKLTGKAGILGGIILIAIGLEIVISSYL